MAKRQDKIIEDLSNFKVNSDGSVQLNNKKLKFIKGKPPKNDKKNPQPKKAFVARWTFKLDQAEEVYINESRASAYYFYKYMSLNGQALQRDTNNQWYIPGKGKISIRGKKGTNTLIAVCGIANNASVDNLRICTGNLKELVQKYGRASTNKDTNDEYRAKPLGNLGEVYSRSGTLMDAKILADILILYYRAYPKQKDKKVEERRRYNISRYNSTWFRNCPTSDRWRYYKTIKDSLPQWVHQSMFFSNDSFNSGNFQYLAESAGRNASNSFFNTYVMPIAKLAKEKSKDSKKIHDLLGRSIYQQMQSLQEVGYFQQSLNILELFDEKVETANSKRYKGAAEQRLQAGAQLAGNPEAQQYYAELQTYLSRGADDERAIDSMVSIFRKAGNKLLIEGLGMRSLNIEMLNEIQKDKAFYQKVVARAQEQFVKRSQYALDKGKLNIMSELIATYALLVDADALHSALLNEYLDRCSYNRARHHALHLLKSNNIETATLAAVKLLLIEKTLQLSPVERSNIPSHLLEKTSTLGGSVQSIHALQKSFGAANASVSNEKLQEPGPVIAFMAHGIPHGADLNGTPDLKTHAPQFSRQTVEPLYTQNSVICSTPSYIRSLNLQTKKTAWSVDQGPASIANNKGYAAKQHHAELINGNIALLWSHPDSHHYTIRAYNKEGILQWDMQDSPDSLRWTPICTPHSAFGMLFTIVYDNTIPNQFQMFLALLDGSNGHIEKTIALNTVFATPAFERGISGIHFTHTADALFGLSGSGVMFKLNRKALTLDWAQGIIYRRYHAYNSPAAFIKVFKDVTIAHLPSMQEWVAVSTRSGRHLWRNVTRNIHFIHSRNTDTHLIQSGTGNVISSVDIKTGESKWRTRANGFIITGEGTVCNDIVYIPCQKGYIRYNIEDGRFIDFTRLPQTINKIRVDARAWYFLTAENLYVCKHGGTFNAAQFNAPSQIIDEKIDAHQYALKNLHNLTPHFTIPEIGDERQTLKVTKLEIPHYFLLTKHGTGNKALLREGFYDKNNTFQPDKIVWIDNSLGLKIEKDKIIQYNVRTITVEGLPNKNPLFYADLSDYHINSESIVGATVKSNTLIIVGDTSRKHKTVTHIDITTKKVLKRFQLDAFGIKYIDDDIFIFSSAKHECACYDIETGKEKWREKISKDIHQHYYSFKLIDKDTLIYGYRGKSKIISKSSGKAISKGIISADPTARTIICKNTIFSGNSVVNLKDGKKDNNVSRVYVDSDAGAAVYYKDKSMKWFGKNKTLDLENPNSDYSINRSRVNNAHVKGNTLFISISNAIFAYDLTTGKKTQREYYSHNNYVCAMLDNSIITAAGPLAFVLRPRKSAPASINLCTVSQNNKDGWPSHGWVKPSRIGKEHWLASSAMKSQHKYAMQCGQDGKNHYIRLFCSPRKNANTERILNTTLTLGSEIEKRFKITWNIDRTPEATINLTQIGKLKSWRKIDKKGNVHCFMILDTNGIDIDYRTPERYCINITEYQSGNKDGAYIFGGIANLKLHDAYGSLASQHITIVQNDDNFVYRKNTYDSNSSIIAQGKDLANWVCTYKALNGHKKTIAYLKEMCKRCHASAIASNILAVLLNEECHEWEDKNPQEITVSDLYRDARLKIMKDLKAFAKGVGVSEEASELGLSIFAVETFPTKNKSFHISWFRSHGSKKERTRIDQSTRGKSPFSSKRISTPHVNTLYLGAFDVTPPTVSTKLLIGDIDAAIGRIEFISPTRHILLTDGDGNLKNGCTAILNHQGKKDNISQDTYSNKGQIYKAMYYNTAGRGKDISYNEIKLAKISTEKFSKKDLMTALNNLPSDSSLGDDIIAKIASKDPIEQETLWKIVLRQIGSNHYDNCIQAIGNLKNLSIAKTKSRSSTNTYLKAVMKKNKIPKNYQQRVFNGYNNSIVDSGRWYNLGVIDKVEGQQVKPAPESIAIDNILNQNFTFNGKKYSFETSSNKHKKGDWNIHYRIENVRSKEPAISYHYSTFDLREDKKLYFYITQANTGRYGCKFTLWIDGKEISSQMIGHGSRFPIAMPLRMKRGEHKILIGLDFQRGWDLRFHIGDAFGMPFDIVDIPPAIPIKK
ncbi:MAG: PQQ-like beta-propeller repeat protein [Planctomycetes bacterium]|nr:PQQ-like beta-propeller repeat protein [Planctomycetota bacterium]